MAHHCSGGWFGEQKLESSVGREGEPQQREASTTKKERENDMRETEREFAVVWVVERVEAWTMASGGVECSSGGGVRDGSRERDLWERHEVR